MREALGLTLAEMEALERQHREHAEAKRQELRSLVGDHYRTVLAASDGIHSMRDTARQLRQALERLPESVAQWSVELGVGAVDIPKDTEEHASDWSRLESVSLQGQLDALLTKAKGVAEEAVLLYVLGRVVQLVYTHGRVLERQVLDIDTVENTITELFGRLRSLSSLLEARNCIARELSSISQSDWAQMSYALLGESINLWSCLFHRGFVHAFEQGVAHAYDGIAIQLEKQLECMDQHTYTMIGTGILDSIEGVADTAHLVVSTGYEHVGAMHLLSEYSRTRVSEVLSYSSVVDQVGSTLYRYASGPHAIGIGRICCTLLPSMASSLALEQTLALVYTHWAECVPLESSGLLLAVHLNTCIQQLPLHPTLFRATALPILCQRMTYLPWRDHYLMLYLLGCTPEQCASACKMHEEQVSDPLLRATLKHDIPLEVYDTLARTTLLLGSLRHACGTRVPKQDTVQPATPREVLAPVSTRSTPLPTSLIPSKLVISHAGTDPLLRYLSTGTPRPARVSDPVPQGSWLSQVGTKWANIPAVNTLLS